MGILEAILSLFRRKEAGDWAADARERLAKGKPARALAAAERALAMKAGDPDLLLLRAEVLRAMGNPAGAAADVLAALDLDPGRAAALLPLLEELEPSAADPSRVWLHTWRVYAEKEDLEGAAERVRRIAARGEAAVEALREQSRGLLAGSGDRRAALAGLALLARERRDAKEAVARVLELTGAGGRAHLAFAERFLQGLGGKGPEAPGTIRALATVRVLLGKEEEARALVVDLCRRDPDTGVALLEELLAGEKPVAAFAMGLAAALEKSGKVPVRLSVLLVEGLLREKRAAEAAKVVLRAVASDARSAEAMLPLATRVMKSERVLDALEAHARAAALAGDDHSALLTVGEFVEKDPARALAVLDLVPADVREREEGALLASRARAGLGEHPRAAADLRRFALGGGGARAKDALPHVRAAAEAHPEVADYALLLHDILESTGDAAGAGRILLDLVCRVPNQAEAVAGHADALLQARPEAFEARLAAARAGLVRASDPGAAIAHLRAAIEVAPDREAEALACLEGAAKWIGGVEPVELLRAELVLRAGRVEEGLAAVEEVVVRNPARGGDALGVLRGFLTGTGAGDSRVLLCEHRVRRSLRDHEGCVLPLRRVADLDEARREEVLRAVDAVVAEAPAGRAAHRAGVEIAIRLGRPVAETLRRLETLLDIPNPPRDTEYVTRRATALQARGATVAGHRLLARCHLFAGRWPLAMEEARRMVEVDPSTRGEAAGLLAHVVSSNPGLREARFQLASVQASLGAVDAAREALAGAVPRTEEVLDAYRRLIEAYPTHAGARLDLVDALLTERRLDEALEEAGKVRALPGGAGPDLVRRIDRILEMSPEYAPALYALADVHHAAGDWAKEIAACRRIIRLAPREAEAILQRLDLVLDRDPRCLEASLEILRLVPLHQRPERSAPEGRRALGAASSPAEVERVADALQGIERELRTDPAFREVLAVALGRAGRARPAVEAWKTLLDLAPDRAAAAVRELETLAAAPGDDGVEAIRHLAVARLLAGQAEGACDAVDLFLKRRPRAVEDARGLYRRVALAHPQSHAAASGIVRTSILAGEPSAAVDALLLDLRQHPDLRREAGRALADLRGKFPKEASIPLAQAEFIHLPLSLLDDAASALDAALDLDPVRHSKVLELADLILQRDPKSVRGTRARARAMAAGGRYDDAVATFRALADLDPKMSEDVLAGLDAVLEDGPGHSEAQRLRAEILVALGRPEDAAEQVEAMLQILRPGDPREFQALLLLSAACEVRGDFDKALDALRLAAKHHPAEPSLPARVRANLAARLAARAATLREARAAGKSAEADLDLAETLLEAGDPPGAVAALGPEPGPGVSLARWRTLRGRAFLVLGSGAEALAELEEAVKQKGVEDARTFPARDALFFCGLAHLRTGEMLKAIRRFEQVARAEPGHRRVREVLDRVYDEDRRRLERPLAVTADLETLRRWLEEAPRG